MAADYTSVSFNGRTSVFKTEDAGSIPVTGYRAKSPAYYIKYYEGKEEVYGS